MTTSELERVGAGRQLRAFSRTISYWQFLLLLAAASVLFATPLALDGRWDAAGLMVGGIALVPIVVGLRELRAESRGLRTLAALHEHGLVWRRLRSTGFVPWREVRAVEARRVDDDDADSVVYDVRLVGEGEASILVDDIGGGAASAQEIERRVAAARSASV